MWSWLPRSQRKRDVLLALASGFVGLLVLAVEPGGVDRPALPAIIVVLAAGALVARHRQPLAVAAITVACRWLVAILDGGEFALLPVVVIALFTLAGIPDRRRGLISAGVLALIGAFLTGLGASESFWWEFLSEAPELLLPIAIADAARSRQERIEALVQAESERRVQSERLRIARDLHDIVAHGLAVIAVQSGTAEHVLDRNPAQAREALGIINQTGRRTLEELRSMVGALRVSNQDPPLPTPADPDDLSDLVDRARTAGVDVELTVTGRFAPETPAAVVTALHRILTEALTNAARHGSSGMAAVSVVHGETSVRLQVDNQVAPVPDRSTANAEPSSGMGLLGIGERTASVGGTMSTDASDGRFRLLVELPYGGAS